MSNKQLYEKENNINKPFFPVVRLEDIIDTISEKSIQWILNNYNHIYVEWKNDIVGTRLSVPIILRRNGLWITYNNGDRVITEYYIGKNTEIKDKHWQDNVNWKDYTNKLIDGTVEYRHLSESLKQLFNKGNITNFPDEEDLTSDGIKLSFKDREYKPENFSGLGRIILRKNIVKVGEEYKNILIQSMFNKENTIYEIRYDFNLNDVKITIPKGCILDFQGGSLNNGTIVGDGTIINANPLKIFTNIITIGTWNINEVYPEWFGVIFDNPSYGAENVAAFNNAIKLQVIGGKKVLLNAKGIVYIDVNNYNNTWGINNPTIELLSNCNIELKNSKIIVNSNDYKGYYVFSAINVENVNLSGGVIVGDVSSHIGEEGEFGFGLYIAGSKNIYISNIEFNEFWGDGIILIYDSSNNSESSGIGSEKHPKYIYIDNVKCLRNRRQGISICDGIDIFISNSAFNDTGVIKSTEPCSGIDIEPNGNWEYIKNVVCINCEFKNNKGNYNAMSWYNNSTGVTDDNLISVKFINCDFTSNNKISKVAVLTSDTMFTNCRFDELWNATGTINQGKYIVQDSEIKRVAFNGTPKSRILKNCVFKDCAGNITWDSLEISNTYLIDCTFIINNNSIVVTNWGGSVYSKNIYNVQPKIINIGDNISYTMEVHKMQFIRPILINCKLDIAVSKPNIITDDYYHMIEAITTTSSMSDGTLASVSKVPLFSYKGKWYDALGFKGQNKSGIHGERPTSLDTTDAGYIFYDASYKKWCYWDGENWKSIGNDYDVIKSIKGSSSNRPTNVSSGFMYYDETINKPIWWTGDKWIDAIGENV